MSDRLAATCGECGTRDEHTDECYERRVRDERRVAAYARDHVCNYPSRYRATLCRIVVRDGVRYCKRHRRGA